MENVKEAGPSQQRPNSFIDEAVRIRLEKYLKILKDFIASNDQVYRFQGSLSGEERHTVNRLSWLMGLGTTHSGVGDDRRTCVYKTEGEDSKQIQDVMSRKRKNREKPESSQNKKSIVDEINRIWLCQILEKFLASSDEEYNFENKLSGKERQLVYQFCQKIGFIYTLSWHGIKEIVSIRKTKKEVDSTTLLESLRNVAFSEESDQVDMLKKPRKEEKPEPPQHQNYIVVESKRVQISRILEKFLASKDEVYHFEHDLYTQDRDMVYWLSQKLGLICTFSGRGIKQKVSVHKTKLEVDTTMASESLPHVTFSEGLNQNKEDPNPPHHQKPIVDVSGRSRINKILEKFLASKNKVYNFEANLSPEECVAVHELSQKMGFRVENSWGAIKHKISVRKIKEVGTTTELQNLFHFSFSEESKQLLGGLLMHYPPGDKSWREIIGTNSNVTDRAEHKEDDFFGVPYMCKADVTKKLEDLAARMKNPSDLKPIAEKRSKLPIASFKDVITSTVESHQVVIVCGESGCGKTTQVPQYILDHIWGKGEVCKIVCTQPRCISATSVSERISRERGETVGDNVGYKIRFESRGGRQSSIVLCTIGVLLKVLVSKGSHLLKTRAMMDNISSITHIIMDEIHERDQYSDLMLAILRDMLPSNPHLRLILMSATLDAARFSQYFGDCPVIHVPGFTHSVKTYYLEDVLSIVKSGEDHLDDNHEASLEEKLSLNEAINLAWSNDECSSLLEFVCSEESPKVINYQHSFTGLSPLMVFAGKGKVGDMCRLLSLGANCHLRAKDGTTALEIAEKENQQVAADLLKKHMDNDFFNNEGKKLLDNYLETVNPELIDVVLIEQLIRKICIDSKDGGILVFLPGWDEINRTRERLLASPFFNDTAKFRVISLHSMIPSFEQERVFMCLPHGCRKIVLSTNIAETAITIDDVVYVIDTGLVKEKSHDPYNNVLNLQTSWVTKTSAKQREGRAGHCQPGICYHLYSKVQAASLPDFQVPEIKRMPLEELCLQVKLLDPSSKIEEFLSRTIDPPGSVSIQNSIAVLQRIGALSLDEKPTQLGEKLGALSVHPLTGRILLFSILMNCLDPVLTLASALEYKNPFMHPILSDEKERAAAARSELASLYGGCGDQFAVIVAYECWKNSKKMGLEERFCSQYFVSQSTMRMLSGMRKKLATELFQNGLIHNGGVSSYCLNAHDPGILHAVLVAGMYPMVGKFLHNGSAQKKIDGSSVVYNEITRGYWGMSIMNCTVGLLPLILLSPEIAVAPLKDCKEGDKFMSSPDNIVRVTIDQWLDFKSTAHDVSQMYYLRERLSAAIFYKVTNSTDVLPPILGFSMDALACVLSCDGLSAILQTSGGADTPTITKNATNLGKSATGTKHVGKNPVGSKTKLKSQDAPQSNPSSKFSVTASKAVEKPIDKASQNAPIGSEQMDKPKESQTKLINQDAPETNPPPKFSVTALKAVEKPSDKTSQNDPIGSEQMDKKPKESKTKLINQDAPETNASSKVSGSSSKAIENPSDQTSQNAPIGLACSIPTEQMEKNPEGSQTELINQDAMPSSEVDTSSSKGIKNQNDLTSQKTAIGSASLIPPEHTANAELVNHNAAMTGVNVPSEENALASKCIENPSDPISQNTPRERHKKKIMVEWTFPEMGWIKANVDGSYKDEACLATCAGVFRDATGSWCFGFARNLGHSFSGVASYDWRGSCKDHHVLFTELWGILTALNLAKEKGISQLWIESDSRDAVDCCLNKSPWNRNICAPIIRSIIELRRGNWTVRISHCYREVNKVADRLSTYAYTTEVGLHVLDVPPPECIELLTDDLVGVYQCRKVRC